MNKTLQLNMCGFSDINILPQHLKAFLTQSKDKVRNVNRAEGTQIISALVNRFANVNGLKIKAEKTFLYNGTTKGQLDFLITCGNFIYPIEIDYYYKERSFQKLRSLLKSENTIPIWIRWNRKSENDDSMGGIFLIDLTTKPALTIRNNEYELYSILAFGQYEGVVLKDVIIKNPKYVRWCLENLKLFKISKEALSLLIDQGV